MNLAFRKATKEDVNIVAQMADSIWKEHYIDIISIAQIDYMLKNNYSPESLLQQMNDGHVFTLAYADKKPVGYISLSTKDNKNYFIHKFYVEVNDHRKGIGSKLFDHVLKQLPSAKAVELMVARINYKTINFYFKHGFIIKKIVDLDIGENFYMNDYLMVKEL
jgi:ribosomal protein S18 acetylase RimI-like enzyme